MAFSDVESRFQAAREKAGHGMSTSLPATPITSSATGGALLQEGVDPDEDAPEVVPTFEDVEPDIDTDADAKRRGLIRAAMTTRSGATPPPLPPGEPGGFRTGDFPEEEGGPPPPDTGDPGETGEADTGDTGGIDTGAGESDTGEFGAFGDTGDTGDTGGYEPATVNAQGVEINEAAITDHGEGLVDDADLIIDVLDDYQREHVYPDTSDADRAEAARIDRHRDRREREEVWSGDGPNGDGKLYFYDGDPPRGYLQQRDGTWVNVTGMLYPPRRDL